MVRQSDVVETVVDLTYSKSVEYFFFYKATFACLIYNLRQSVLSPLTGKSVMYHNAHRRTVLPILTRASLQSDTTRYSSILGILLVYVIAPESDTGSCFPVLEIFPI